MQRKSNKVIGGIGLKKVDLKNKRAEIGYWLGKKYWSRGYMTQAVRLILKFAFKELKLHRVDAELFKPNQGSRRVLEKSGFKLEGEKRDLVYRYNKYQNFLIFSILESEY